MINKEEMIKLLCKSYPCLRDRIVSRANEWISEDGSILYIILISSLSALVLERFIEGNYDNSDELFVSVEVLLENGDGQVKDIIATGFLESMQNQTELRGKYWAPLLGRHATEFCRGMDEFHAVKTEGLRATICNKLLHQTNFRRHLLCMKTHKGLDQKFTCCAHCI